MFKDLMEWLGWVRKDRLVRFKELHKKANEDVDYWMGNFQLLEDEHSYLLEKVNGLEEEIKSLKRKNASLKGQITKLKGA